MGEKMKSEIVETRKPKNCLWTKLMHGNKIDSLLINTKSNNLVVIIYQFDYCETYFKCKGIVLYSKEFYDAGTALDFVINKNDDTYQIFEDSITISN